MKRDRQLLKEIQGVLETEERRTVAAERVAQLIRGRGAYRWVGIYAVEGDEIAALAWSGPQEPAHPRFPASEGENVFDQVGKNSLTFHPRAEAGIVQPAAAKGADAGKHLGFFLREVLRHPGCRG